MKNLNFVFLMRLVDPDSCHIWNPREHLISRCCAIGRLPFSAPHPLIMTADLNTVNGVKSAEEKVPQVPPDVDDDEDDMEEDGVPDNAAATGVFSAQ